LADDEHVVIHFTIKGRHTGQWGSLPGTGKDVAFDEIVIMTVRDGKVVHQVGMIDNVTGLRQVGVLPPAEAWNPNVSEDGSVPSDADVMRRSGLHAIGTCAPGR
jgi:hypothetical protein